MATIKEVKELIKEVRDSQEKLIASHQRLIKSHTALETAVKGLNGQDGLLATVHNHSKRIRRVEIILAGILGSGCLGGGIFGLIQLLTG